MTCRRKSRMQVWALFLLSTWMKERGHGEMLVQAFSSVSILQSPYSRSCGSTSLLRKTNTENSDLPPSVPITPCTRICRYNANVFDGHVCIGCFRDTYEIGNWESMAPLEKYYALLDAVDRLEEVVKGPTIDESATGTSRLELLRQAEYWKAEAARAD
jgi:predicted Fe-S protein YdhL (DUF1289 family)